MRLGERIADLGLQAVLRIDFLLDNLFIEEDLLKAVPSLQAGEALTAALGRSKFITPMIREMLYIGEESGRLPEQFQRVADKLDEDVVFGLRNTVKMLWIMLLLLVAAIVGYIVISFWVNYYGGMLNDLGV